MKINLYHLTLFILMLIIAAWHALPTSSDRFSLMEFRNDFPNIINEFETSVEMKKLLNKNTFSSIEIKQLKTYRKAASHLNKNDSFLAVTELLFHADSLSIEDYQSALLQQKNYTLVKESLNRCYVKITENPQGKKISNSVFLAFNKPDDAFHYMTKSCFLSEIPIYEDLLMKANQAEFVIQGIDKLAVELKNEKSFLLMACRLLKRYALQKEVSKHMLIGVEAGIFTDAEYYQSLLETGDQPFILVSLSNRVNANPKSFFYLNKYFLHLKENNKLIEANQILESLLAENPKSLEILKEKIQLNRFLKLNEKNLPLAEEILKIEISKDNLKTYREALILHEKLEEVKVSLEKMMKGIETLEDASLFAATVMVEKNSPKQALQILILNGKQEYLNQIKTLCLQINDKDLALESLKNLQLKLSHLPQFWQVSKEILESYFLPYAVSEFQEIAFENSFVDEKAFYESLLKTGDSDYILLKIKKILDKKPDSIFLLNAMLTNYLGKSQLKEAKEMALKLVELNPNELKYKESLIQLNIWLNIEIENYDLNKQLWEKTEDTKYLYALMPLLVYRDEKIYFKEQVNKILKTDKLTSEYLEIVMDHAITLGLFNEAIQIGLLKGGDNIPLLKNAYYLALNKRIDPYCVELGLKLLKLTKEQRIFLDLHRFFEIQGDWKNLADLYSNNLWAWGSSAWRKVIYLRVCKLSGVNPEPVIRLIEDSTISDEKLQLQVRIDSLVNETNPEIINKFVEDIPEKLLLEQYFWQEISKLIEFGEELDNPWFPVLLKAVKVKSGLLLPAHLYMKELFLRKRYTEVLELGISLPNLKNKYLDVILMDGYAFYKNNDYRNASKKFINFLEKKPIAGSFNEYLITEFLYEANDIKERNIIIAELNKNYSHLPGVLELNKDLNKKITEKDLIDIESKLSWPNKYRIQYRYEDIDKLTMQNVVAEYKHHFDRFGMEFQYQGWWAKKDSTDINEELNRFAEQLSFMIGENNKVNQGALYFSWQDDVLLPGAYYKRLFVRKNLYSSIKPYLMKPTMDILETLDHLSARSGLEYFLEYRLSTQLTIESFGNIYGESWFKENEQNSFNLAGWGAEQSYAFFYHIKWDNANTYPWLDNELWAENEEGSRFKIGPMLSWSFFKDPDANLAYTRNKELYLLGIQSHLDYYISKRMYYKQDLEYFFSFGENANTNGTFTYRGNLLINLNERFYFNLGAELIFGSSKEEFSDKVSLWVGITGSF